MALPAAQGSRKIWEPDAPLPTLADFAPPHELLLVAATIADTCPKLMKRKVGWPSYAKYLGVGLGGAPRQTWATFNAKLGAHGAREMASIFVAQHLAELSSPQQAAAADFLQRLLLTREGADVLIRVSLQLYAADLHTSHVMDVYGEREGEVHGLWWAVKRLLFAILQAMIRNGMCPAPTTSGDGRHCCAPPQLRSSQCLVAFEHAPSRQERWWSLHPCMDWLCAECCKTVLDENDWVCPRCGTEVTNAESFVTPGFAAAARDAPRTPPVASRTSPQTPPHARDTEQTHAPLPGDVEEDTTQQTEVAWSEHGSPGASHAAGGPA